MYIYNIVIVQSNKVQTCYTRYANIYIYFFREKRKEQQRNSYEQ